jgi:hypothetical protein
MRNPPEPEIYRLIDLMPASGRMFVKIVDKPQQQQVMSAPLPLPWQARLIEINFDLWSRLPKPQRDLLLLRSTCWLMAVKWFRPNFYQAGVVTGAIGTTIELLQADAIGSITAAGLMTLAGAQLWRSSRKTQRELEADEAAIRVAQRRGYSELDAARHLLAGLESAACIENRSNLSFTELLRYQNLRAIGRLSAVDVPETLRQE